MADRKCTVSGCRNTLSKNDLVFTRKNQYEGGICETCRTKPELGGIFQYTDNLLVLRLKKVPGQPKPDTETTHKNTNPKPARGEEPSAAIVSNKKRNKKREEDA